MNLALFDFDGTITTGDRFTSFLFPAVRRAAQQSRGEACSSAHSALDIGSRESPAEQGRWLREWASGANGPTRSESWAVAIQSAAPIVLGSPLRGGRWLVHTGPGNNQSPHWGSVLARNGRVTVPQRFAVDWIGVDDRGRAVKRNFRKSANEDWVGFGADVVAVADGIVRDVRDGWPTMPLSSNPHLQPL